MIGEIAGSISLGIWIYLASARGNFWRVRAVPEGAAVPAGKPPGVAVIVPARDEAEVVGEAIRSLLQQDYSGPFRVFLVDDASTDDTAMIARRAASEIGKSDLLTVVAARPLERGWTGKLWAMSEGLRAAASYGADYILFTDADIVHPAGSIGALVDRAERGELALVSLIARLCCESFAERMLIPAFVFFFFMLYPPEWVSEPRRRTAAAAGGCILIREVALARMGGLAAIRGELIDDCALARAVKQSGGRIRLGPAAEVRSVRSYASWRQIERMIARTAFTELRYSALLLAGTLAAMLLVFAVPPALVLCGGWSAVAGLAAWLLMAVLYAPTLRYYKTSPLQAALLPLIAVFYMGATLHSALLHWKGQGGQWKGRVQNA